MIRIVCVVVLALAGCGLGASAAAENVSGFYFGAGVGATWASVFDNNYDNNDCCYYYYYDNYDYESSDAYASLTAHAGYRFGRYVAAEVGYFYVDNPEWDEHFVYVDDLNDVYNSDVDLEYQAVQVSVLGVLPFAQIWEVYVRGGVAFSQSQADQHLVRIVDGAVLDRSVDDDATDFLFGIGAGFSPTPSWHFRLELMTVPIDNDLLNAHGDASLDTVKIEVQYRPNRTGAPTSVGLR